MTPLGTLPAAPLRLALRASAACAGSESDPVLRELAMALGRLAGEPGLPPGGGELQLRERLLGLGERCVELRLRAEAAACLQHAEPARARMGQVLLALPWPAPCSLSDEVTLVPGALDLGAAEALLGEVQALVEKSDAQAPRAALTLLELTPLRARLLALCAEAATVLTRHRSADKGGRSWQAEAAELLARYRAYVVVSTGKLAAGGEDPARRQRLLQPLTELF